MTKLAAEYTARALKTRSFLGCAKVCANCGTTSHPGFRKCINPRCKGDIFRNETTEQSAARLNAYDAEQGRMAALLTELSGGAL